MDLEVETLKHLLQQKIITSDEYRHQLQEITIRVLQTEKDVEFHDFLGQGSFGTVISAYCPVYGKKMALKIVDQDDTSAEELELWPILDHQNLLPLLDIIELPYTYIFVTPILFEDMETFLEGTDFLNSPHSLQLAKKWLREILHALEHLHSKKLCHLDLKANNILIDFQFTAVLCDFSFITSSDEPIDWFGVPIPYRPPETCLAVDEDVKVNAVNFEMWTYGILALNVLTGHFIKHKYNSDMKYWHNDIYPLIFETMKVSYFRTLMESAFPGSNITDDFIKGFNFVQFLLRLNPDDRPSAECSANHVFFKDGFSYLEVPDDIWLTKDMSNWSCSCTGTNKSLKYDNFDTFKFRNSSRKHELPYKPKKNSSRKHGLPYKPKKNSSRIHGLPYKPKKKWTKPPSKGTTPANQTSGYALGDAERYDIRSTVHFDAEDTSVMKFEAVEPKKGFSESINHSTEAASFEVEWIPPKLNNQSTRGAERNVNANTEKEINGRDNVSLCEMELCEASNDSFHAEAEMGKVRALEENRKGLLDSNHPEFEQRKGFCHWVRERLTALRKCVSRIRRKNTRIVSG